MPSDSKLYVYLNPARFLADTTTTFDPRLYAGWVPHQHIAYLWPMGPWFWFFDTIGVPDWIAHRLWVGTLLVAAGLGVRWVSRLLGLGPPRRSSRRSSTSSPPTSCPTCRARRSCCSRTPGSGGSSVSPCWPPARAMALRGRRGARGAHRRCGQRHGAGDDHPRSRAVAPPRGLAAIDHLATGAGHRGQGRRCSRSPCRCGGSRC